MSEIVPSKAAAVVLEEGAAQAGEQLPGKCPRTPQKKVPEIGESRVANLISVFSGRTQDEVAPNGVIGPRRWSTGEKSYQRRGSSQSGASDGSSAEVCRDEAEKSQSPPVKKEKTQGSRDLQRSQSKDTFLKTPSAAVPSSSQVVAKEAGSPEEVCLAPDPAMPISPIAKKRSSKIESNPFIQNDQKKLVEFGSPVKGGSGGYRRSQKNTNTVTHVEDTHEHSQGVSTDNAITNGHHQQFEQLPQHQPGPEYQRNNSSPCQVGPSITQSPDFSRKSKASLSPDSPRKVPMTPKMKGAVWSVSLVPGPSVTEPTLPVENPASTKEAEPGHPLSQDDQDDHVYDDVVPSLVIRQSEGGTSNIIPVEMVPQVSLKMEGRGTEEEVCMLVPFQDNWTPKNPVMSGEGSVEPASSIAIDQSLSLQQEDQEEVNESFEVVDPKDAVASEDDLTKSPRSEKKFKWKLFGKKKKKHSPSESTAEEEEQRKKKAAVKKRGSIPRTAIKLKPGPEEGPADSTRTSGDGEQVEQGGQRSTPDSQSADSRRDSTSFLDVGVASPLEQSGSDGNIATSVSMPVFSEASQGCGQAAGSAPHLELALRAGSHSGTDKNERKDKTISREIYDIIVSGLDTSKGSLLGDVNEQDEGSGHTLAVPPTTSPQSNSRGMSEDSSSESEVEDPSRRDTRSEGSPMHESPSGGDLALERQGSIMENPEAVETTPLMYADALWDHVGIKPGELSFKVGNVIAILDMTDEQMWHGSIGEKNGWFLASFVRLRVAQGEDEEGQGPQTKLPVDQVKVDVVKAPVVKRALTIRRKDGSNSESKKLSPLEVRAKVVEEILNTERDYVNHLRDIVEGYLQRCKEHSRLFTSEKIELIFGNIETLYKFQKDFLKELETRVNRDKMEESQIGDIFVANEAEFTIYSEYCNNHPHAVHEMNSLQLDDQYTFFFESCRLLQNLQDISLEGYLLTPVQKICKYPLQLSELLKYTSEEHPDHLMVKKAQEVMKGVAMLINEQKRRMENVGKIGQWQETITDWKGEDILETSTELIYSGELHKISKGHSQERHFFLFDHQIIYCKKDAIGGKLTYKGRLCVDNCETVDLQDGVVVYGGTAIKYAWKMSNKDKEKWYVVYAKSAVQKAEWMEAFQAERERVREDNDKGFRISLKMKKSAVALCNATATSRYRRKSFQKKNAITESGESTPRKMVNANAKTKSGKRNAVIGSPVSLKKSIS